MEAAADRHGIRRNRGEWPETGLVWQVAGSLVPALTGWMDALAVQDQIDRTERGCYDRYNKLRNEGYGRTL